MSWAEIIGYAGAALSIATNSMRTMIPLRCFGIATNVVMIAYSFLGAVYPTLVVHLVVLPLNVVRLVQMLRLIRKVREASAGDLSMDWLKPFMTKRAAKAGDVLFRKGDCAECLFYTLAGRFRLGELGLEIGPGQVVGELGLLAPENRRTATLEVVEDGDVLTISYDQIRQLYFQNPAFGFYFLRLSSGRLFANMARLEEELARLRGAAPPEAGRETPPSTVDRAA